MSGIIINFHDSDLFAQTLVSDIKSNAGDYSCGENSDEKNVPKKISCVYLVDDVKKLPEFLRKKIEFTNPEPNNKNKKDDGKDKSENKCKKNNEDVGCDSDDFSNLENSSDIHQYDISLGSLRWSKKTKIDLYGFVTSANLIADLTSSKLKNDNNANNNANDANINNSHGNKSDHVNHCAIRSNDCSSDFVYAVIAVVRNINNGTDGEVEIAGASITNYLNSASAFVAYIFADIDNSKHLALLLSGMYLRNYIFNKYFHDKKSSNRIHLERINLYCKQSNLVQDHYEKLAKIAAAVHMARDLINEPGNVLYPRSYIECCKSLSRYGLHVKVIDRSQLKALGMNGLLGVGQGSVFEPYVVVFEWNGKSRGEHSENRSSIDANLNNKDGDHLATNQVNYHIDVDKLLNTDSTAGSYCTAKAHCDDEGVDPIMSPMTKIAPHVALVGKGVTFDSGGINIKTGSFGDMKYDMAGSAVVVAAMTALALNNAPIDAVGIIGLVENMTDGAAQRPGDVVRSMSGQTIEVDNTDAEGRIVLADIMCYVQRAYKPSVLIDFATLTGAIVVALGEHYAGLFSDSDQLSTDLYRAGVDTCENMWRMPMGDAYDKQINSSIADVCNTGVNGRGGSSITAAHFLKRFVEKSTKHWAHIDIAGVSWATSQKDDLFGRGATGYGVRMILRYLDSIVARDFA